MKVREIMSRAVDSCTPETNLAAAGELMWNRDCGVLPVLDHGGELTGVITDRDICIALATRNLPASEVTVRDVVYGGRHFCNTEDDLATALETMREARVRRLPVLNMAGRLEGMLSLSDIVLHSPHRGRSAGFELIFNTLKAICEPRARKASTADAPLPAAKAAAS